MADLESRLANFLAQSLEGIGLFQKMTPAKRLFEERDHVALYASSRPTLPHKLVQDIINYLNRKRIFYYLFGLFQRMTPAKRLFEERDHVALYASSRPTLPHTLVQEIIDYLNRKLFFLFRCQVPSFPYSHTFWMPSFLAYVNSFKGLWLHSLASALKIQSSYL